MSYTSALINVFACCTWPSVRMVRVQASLIIVSVLLHFSFTLSVSMSSMHVLIWFCMDWQALFNFCAVTHMHLMNYLWMPGCPETSAMDVVLSSNCRPTYSRHRQQKHIHVWAPTVSVPCHFAVLSKRAAFVCRASGGKRRSEGMVSPLVLIMGLSCSTVLLDGSGCRSFTGALLLAVRAVLA